MLTPDMSVTQWWIMAVVSGIALTLAAQSLAAPLESLRSWLVHNNATVMAVLLLVIGVTLVGKGLGSF